MSVPMEPLLELEWTNVGCTRTSFSGPGAVAVEEYSQTLEHEKGIRYKDRQIEIVIFR